MKLLERVMMLSFFILPSLLFGQIPRTISYQGVLTSNETDEPRQGEFSFIFSLYDTSGISLWSEQKILTVNNGLFSTLLGDTEPLGGQLKFDQPYVLGIKVGDEPELSPRVPLTSVGYSLSSARADTAMVSVASLADTTWKSSGTNIYRLEGKVGIGTTSPFDKLHVAGSIWVSGHHDGSNRVVFSDQNAVGKQWELYPSKDYFLIYNRTDGSAPMAILNDGNVGIGTTNPTSKLEVVGRTKTRVLEITGGADLAEPFEMSNSKALPLGSLVIIDPDNPGKMKQSTEPYDKRVAGVISGAGGISPGLTLSQNDNESGQHVALTGKVYALATASNGAIEPGDLLTTSEIPGHAMKATEKQLSFGAVIGKAMSSVEHGKGLVLVLVSLQ